MKTNKQLEFEVRAALRQRNIERKCCKNWKFVSGLLAIGYGGLLSVHAQNPLPMLVALILIALHKRIAKIW